MRANPRSTEARASTFERGIVVTAKLRAQQRRHPISWRFLHYYTLSPRRIHEGKTL
jgi:hypothetical protein